MPAYVKEEREVQRPKRPVAQQSSRPAESPGCAAGQHRAAARGRCSDSEESSVQLQRAITAGAHPRSCQCCAGGACCRTSPAHLPPPAAAAPAQFRSGGRRRPHPPLPHPVRRTGRRARAPPAAACCPGAGCAAVQGCARGPAVRRRHRASAAAAAERASWRHRITGRVMMAAPESYAQHRSSLFRLTHAPGLDEGDGMTGSAGGTL